MAYDNEKKPHEKKEAFDIPKMVNLDGKELTDQELEEASGGAEAAPNTCYTGTGSGQHCHTGTAGYEEAAESFESVQPE